MFRTRLIQISLLVALASTSSVHAQVKAQPEAFVLDPNRPFVYLKFDHFGPGEPWGTEDAPFRLWFKLVNNCKVTIQVRTFGGPDDALGVMDQVVEDEKPFMVETGLGPEPEPISISESIPERTIAGASSQSAPTNDNRTKKTETLKPERPMPRGYGYMGEVFSSLSLASGKEVLFSLPANHLSTKWHFEIPFTFAAPAVRCCRAEEVGGEPEMHLRYDLYDLPDNIQVKIKKM